MVSAMHFFVATFHRRDDLLLRLSPQKSTYGKFITHTANKLQHATAARARDAQPHCRFKSPFYRTSANTRISFILPETRIPELHDSSGVVSCIASLPIDSVPMVSYYVLYSNCVCKMCRFGDTRLLKLP